MAIVYALRCKMNDFVYVGSTKNAWKRYREHRCLLRNEKHQETRLQADWRAYGENAFEMVELQRLPSDCNISTKRDAEMKWIALYERRGRLYNRNAVAYGLTKESLRRAHSPEARRKAGLAQRGKPKGHGAKISATKKALGQRPTLEAARAGGLAATAKRWHGIEAMR